MAVPGTPRPVRRSPEDSQETVIITPRAARGRVGWNDWWRKELTGCMSTSVMVLYKIVPDIRKGSEGQNRPEGAVVSFAGVAQLVEHLICNQRVGGSNPFASSSSGTSRSRGAARVAEQDFSERHSIRNLFQVWCTCAAELCARNFCSSNVDNDDCQLTLRACAQPR